MIVKAEVYQGEGYLLTECGDIWRMKIAGDGEPTIELLYHVNRDQVRRFCAPSLPRNIDCP